MSILNYTSFFHDGSILDIKHAGDKIEFSMESAEMDLDDIKDDVLLSEDDRIKGQLHIEGIRSIVENGREYAKTLKMKYQDAGILHFELNKNKVKFDIMWSSFPPNPSKEDYSTIEIAADKIWWENIPNLED